MERYQKTEYHAWCVYVDRMECVILAIFYQFFFLVLRPRVRATEYVSKRKWENNFLFLLGVIAFLFFLHLRLIQFPLALAVMIR